TAQRSGNPPDTAAFNGAVDGNRPRSRGRGCQNWDKNKETPFPGGIVIPDDEMGRLHKVGFAQEFDMRGSSSTFSHDMNSDAPPAVNAADPGRDGGRGDVSRGDEENR
ncbi:hypothetical protein ACFYXM_26470, partial [Streptomyces sp. NPDC002476]